MPGAIGSHPSALSFVVTCEHGGNEVPRSYAHLFRGPARALLKTHRGYDAGAFELGREIARALGAPFVFSKTTRLLVDLNRSLGHPQLFSESSNAVPPSAKTEILRHHYFPFRAQVEAVIAGAIADGRQVLHISCHSFTPVWNGSPRDADVGLLYDPRRPRERLFCRRLQRRMQAIRRPYRLRVRRNYPYRGTADGFTVHLRRRFDEASYAGIELEVNQRHTRPPRHWAGFRRRVVAVLLEAVHAERG